MGPTTEFHPQSRAWPLSSGGGGQKYLPIPGGQYTWFWQELWAQSLDFHLREELDHKPVPGSGVGGRRELPL